MRKAPQKNDLRRITHWRPNHWSCWSLCFLNAKFLFDSELVMMEIGNWGDTWALKCDKYWRMLKESFVAIQIDHPQHHCGLPFENVFKCWQVTPQKGQIVKQSPLILKKKLVLGRKASQIGEGRWVPLDEFISTFWKLMQWICIVSLGICDLGQQKLGSRSTTWIVCTSIGVANEVLQIWTLKSSQLDFVFDTAIL